MPYLKSTSCTCIYLFLFALWMFSFFSCLAFSLSSAIINNGETWNDSVQKPNEAYPVPAVVRTSIIKTKANNKSKLWMCALAKCFPCRRPTPGSDYCECQYLCDWNCRCLAVKFKNQIDIWQNASFVQNKSDKWKCRFDEVLLHAPKTILFSKQNSGKKPNKMT